MTLDDLRKIAEAAASVRTYTEEDAEFIATFNPSKVLELLARLAEHEQAVENMSTKTDDLLSKLAAVEKLHQPVEIEPSDTICGPCSFQLPNGKYFGKIVEYPCDTIKAVRGE